MLFNSTQFLYVFLPLTLIGFFLLARVSRTLAAAWLTGASIFFYGWWDARYVPLLLGSVLFNFWIARLIGNSVARSRRGFLILGICGDLALLAYFKYAHFLLGTFNFLTGGDIGLAAILLPLGISFFTFTQIAFLVDTYRSIASEPRLLHYTLFVTWFPHLIAGPILHHSEMMPQFVRQETYRASSRDISVGVTIFCIGLFKKVILADSIARFAVPAFSAAASGSPLSMLEAWGGALAYALQLYFDFSGYSDMAIGASRLFGIRLPLNFNSPYKAASIIDFWRRWHMTLSRFLRDYLYFALGGNRKGAVRRYVNLFVTMLLGGLWHGAGWTYVAWGALHGVYLMINHAWLALRRALGLRVRSNHYTHACALTVTFLSVLVGWVFFRASSFGAAIDILSGMAGLHGIVLPPGWEHHFPAALTSLLSRTGIVFHDSSVFGGAMEIGWIAALLAIALFGPNTQQLLRLYEPALESAAPGRPAPAASEPAIAPAPGPAMQPSPGLAWRPSLAWAVGFGILAVASFASLDRVTQFLYFQF